MGLYIQPANDSFLSLKDLIMKKIISFLLALPSIEPSHAVRSWSQFSLMNQNFNINEFKIVIQFPFGEGILCPIL